MPTTEQANPDHARILIANRREEIERAEQSLIAALDRHKYPDAAKFAVRLALEEALVNAFRHGHKDLEPDVPVTLEYRVTDTEAEMAIEDRGPGFDPGDVPDPTLDENLTVPTGRGLLLMRAYMARVEYVGKGNRVEMVYKR
ncbi:MAG: ATP-binding protein [Phycisphaerales bacterium]